MFDLESLIFRAREIGKALRLNPQGRLAASAARLERLMAIPRAVASPAETTLYAQLMLDLWIATEVYDGLQLPGAPANAQVRLKRALGSGLVEVPLPPAADKPRDELWELQIASRLLKNGMPVAFEEPDILTSMNGKPYLVALKRVRSSATIVERLREAAVQIRRQVEPGRAHDGGIYMDLSYAIAMSPRRLRTVPTKAALAPAKQGISAELRELCLRLDSVLKEKEPVARHMVAGIFVFATPIHLVADTLDVRPSQWNFVQRRGPTDDPGDLARAVAPAGVTPEDLGRV